MAVALIRNVWMQVSGAELREAQRAQHLHYSTALSDEPIFVTRHIQSPRVPFVVDVEQGDVQRRLGALLSLGTQQRISVAKVLHGGHRDAVRVIPVRFALQRDYSIRRGDL